ncbi:hypothetical protein LCGC14_1229280, partial [marine sediment metagenome]
MFEVKKGDAFKAYFKLVDSTDFATPENGVANTGVTGAYTKNGAGAVNLNMAAANRWTDLSGSVSGLYVVTVPTGATDTIGELIVAVIDDGAGVAGAARVFKVVSHPSDDIYDKVSSLNINAAAIADAVWDELSTGHTGAGKAGKMLFDVISNINVNLPSANAVADAVWNELSTGHTDAGKAGRKMWHKVSQIQASVAQARTDIGNLTDIDAAAVEDACSAALATCKLKQLLATNASLTVGSTTVKVSSVIGKMLNKAPGTAWAYALATDSLEALRDNQAAAGGDWTANEKTEFKAILGIKNTGTPGDPTAGILFDDLLDGKVWDVLSTGHVGAGRAGKRLWHSLDATSNAIINNIDPSVNAISNAVINNIDPSINGISNIVANDIDPSINGISNVVKGISNVVANEIEPSTDVISNYVKNNIDP